MLEEKDIEKVDSEDHSDLLAYVKRRVDKSRKDMRKHHAKWEKNDSVFRSERSFDTEDRKAMSKGQPGKMVIPLSKSQVLSFVSYCLITMTQNRRFFEIEPTGSEDNPLAESVELILERDVRRNRWSSFLLQFLLDVGVKGLGCAEVCWEEVRRKVRTEVKGTESVAFGGEVQTSSVQYIDVPVNIGNTVHSISPYRFFPDTNFPVDQYQRGEFCASEDFWSYTELVAFGDCINLDKIPKMSKTDLEARESCTKGDFSDFQTRQKADMGGDNSAEAEYVTDGKVLVTKGVYELIPAKVKIDGKPIGKETFPVRFVIWYANDKVIIRYTEANDLHGYFPYIASTMLPDQTKALADSLADDCSQLTDLITWLCNAHITSIRGHIEGKLIVDPAGIDVKSLENRGPFIYLKRNASQTGVDRYIKELQRSEPTANFLQEVQGLTELLEKCTGFGNNMMGQFANGRRSATEARGVSQGATSRAKTILSHIWDSAFEPLGRMLLCNNRQMMEQDTFNRIVGSTPSDQMDSATLFSLFKSDPESIASSEDFFVFDGTLPSEKAFLAQSLQELMMQLFQSPEMLQVMGYGPNEIRILLDEIYNLRGVTMARLPVPQMGQTPPPAILPMALPSPSSAVS